MVLAVINNPFHYEMEKLTMAFFPETKFRVERIGTLEAVRRFGKIGASNEFSKLFPNDTEVITVMLYSDISAEKETGRNAKHKLIEILVQFESTESDEFLAEAESVPCDMPIENMELVAARLLYRVLSKATGVEPSWGVLTGVRPSKLMHKLMTEMGDEGAKSYFTDSLLVTPKKTELAMSVAKAEQKIMAESKPDSFSFYVSIPFCPGRCSYCSFVSSAVNTPSAQKLIPVYFENLLAEIKRSGELAREAGIQMLSAYVGGGTPSILTAEQIDTLLQTVYASFDMSHCREFTFEAGRPDTITAEKLSAIMDNGIDRISINPQTMSDDVLSAVGRHHSVQQVYDAYSAARSLGFRNINMDLIAGLPSDTPSGFEDSVRKIVDLSPESITVHTLSYKRSSDLSFDDGMFAHTKDTALMVDKASEILYDNGYIPYYMYRQTKSVGNLENVGWCKPGYESIYNIYMMEECHTILACGAGAVTKLKDPYGLKLERIFNFKYPYEYNDRFEELLARKEALRDFYARRTHD